MSGGTLSTFSARRRSLDRVEQIVWELRRGVRGVTRRFGVWGWAWASCALLTLVAGFMVRHDAAELAEARLRATAETSRRASATVNGPERRALPAPDSRELLHRFEQNLLPHGDIPAVVQALLRLAQDEGLSNRRGDYRLQTDSGGGFVRYQMILPVKGAAPAVHRFIQAALLDHSALALESVQFKREGIESSEIEARLQWVLLTEPPGIKARPTRSGTLEAEVSR